MMRLLDTIAVIVVFMLFSVVAIGAVTILSGMLYVLRVVIEALVS